MFICIAIVPKIGWVKCVVTNSQYQSDVNTKYETQAQIVYEYYRLFAVYTYDICFFHIMKYCYSILCYVVFVHKAQLLLIWGWWIPTDWRHDRPDAVFHIPGYFCTGICLNWRSDVTVKNGGDQGRSKTSVFYGSGAKKWVLADEGVGVLEQIVYREKQFTCSLGVTYLLPSSTFNLSSCPLLDIGIPQRITPWSVLRSLKLLVRVLHSNNLSDYLPSFIRVTCPVQFHFR